MKTPIKNNEKLNRWKKLLKFWESLTDTLARRSNNVRAN